MGSQRTIWRVLRVVTISLWGDPPGIDAAYTCIVAAAAKSLQSCPTLCNPIDGSPPGSPVPLSMYYPCIINCLTGFFSAHVNKLQHAVQVQQGFIKLPPTMENITHP